MIKTNTRVFQKINNNIACIRLLSKNKFSRQGAEEKSSEAHKKDKVQETKQKEKEHNDAVYGDGLANKIDHDNSWMNMNNKEQ